MCSRQRIMQNLSFYVKLMAVVTVYQILSFMNALPDIGMSKELQSQEPYWSHSSSSHKPQSVVFGLNGTVRTLDIFALPLIEDDSRDDRDPWIIRDEAEAECTPMYDWQTTPYLTCNSMHENSYSYLYDDDAFHVVAFGVNRVVYRLDEPSTRTRWALKTRHIRSGFSESTMKKEGIESTISEKLTSSPNVANMYIFCGASSLYDWADEGTLLDNYVTLNRGERLHAALDAARGLADLHGLGGGMHSPFIHSDLGARQYVKLNGSYQLNDFNCAKVLEWNKKENKVCKYVKDPHPSKNRAPEEQKGAMTEIDGHAVIDEKTDNYVLGNIFYQLLVNKFKYDDLKSKDGIKLVLAGDVPKVPSSLENSTDVVAVALRTAMRMCLVLDPEKRASSSQVVKYLEKQAKKLEQESDKQLNQPWKVPEMEDNIIHTL